MTCLYISANVYYFQPSNGFCGDPMPFYDTQAGVFRIYYLQEFRPNPEVTYHPIYAAETGDLVHYTALGEVLPTGTAYDQDAAIGTGSVIYRAENSTYYLFYTGNRYQPDWDQCRQVIMCATSSDAIHWSKTDFRLEPTIGYYYRDDFRDPEVFQDDNGLYHMFVATGKDGRNVLADFTSYDLIHWNDNGVFMTTMWDRFYECPNVFKMGNWWYLVYSELHSEIRRVQYFKAHTLDELRFCTADDIAIWPDNHEGYLDSRGFYAGKTASDGSNRYIWGWCPTRRNYDNTAVNNEGGEPDWAGTLVAHRLIQHPDGSLTLGEIDNINRYFNADMGLPCTSVNLDAGQYQLFPTIQQQTHLSFTLTTSGDNDIFGISVCRGAKSNLFYSAIVNAEQDGLRKINFEQEGGMGFIPYIDGYFFSRPADNTYHVNIYIDNSIFVLYINDIASYTNRIYGMLGHGWSINCYSGSVQVSHIRQQIYDPNAQATVNTGIPSDNSTHKRIENNQLVISRSGIRYTPLGITF